MSTIEINGVTTEVPAGAIAFKFADPTEDARWVYDESDLADIRREDPSLIVDVDSGEREAAIAAVEAAPWDENDTALSGADIWGTHGSFAAPRASSFFTYRRALAEAERA